MTSRIIILAAAGAISAYAGDNPRTVTAVRIQTPPRIDGSLDEAVWRLAEPATDFIQRDPEEGKPASEGTEVRVLYDDEALYFGCLFRDSEPSKIVARLTRRDNEIESDEASIRIDSYHDHQTGYEFTFNAAGVKIDKLQYDDANNEDDSWDPVWDLQVRINEAGWSAEAKIPFRILRYRSGGDSSNLWGINFIRYISRKQETERWAFTPKSQSGFISRFGHLAGLRNLPPPGQVEALPFATSKESYVPENSVQPRREDFRSNAGLDLKYRVSNNFVVDATFNPDFGQVEADLAVLNLSTFETFYPEKRRFFIEGTQIVHFTTFGGPAGPGMFYSRRIGRAISPFEVSVPQGGTIEELSQNVTILGAAKVSGKTDEGLSIGALQALTREENSTVRDSSGAVSQQTLEPFASYSVVRLKQDVLENSNVGLIVTSTVKDHRPPAFTNGYDWSLKFGKNTYQLDGFLALSQTTNQADERVTGSAGKVNFSRIAAEHWLWGLGTDFTSPKYNINDVGFFFSPDDIGGIFNLTYKEDVPARVVRNYRANLFLHMRDNFEGINLIRACHLSGGLLFANYWSMNLDADADAGLYDQRETRGNGLYKRPAAFGAGVSVSSDPRTSVTLDFGETLLWDSKSKHGNVTNVTLTMRPLSWVEWSLESTYRRIRDQQAWADNVTVGGETKSIFADRSTDEISISARGTITFTRELTLQLYGQVFLPKGHYDNLRQLSGTDEFVPPVNYTRDPDFNKHILNSNVVLRWEYLPGSTLFLVWSQSRQGENTGNYFTTLHGDLNDTFGVPPSNVLLLKVSYLLNS